MKIYFLLGLFLGLAACAPNRTKISANPGPGIIGGGQVPPESLVALSVVALEASDGANQYLCTGVLLGQNAVLTAAHCGADLKRGELVFSTDLSTATADLRRAVSEVQISPQFAGVDDDGSKDWGDLAILKFSGTVPPGYKAAQIGNGKQLSNGETVIVAGFGITNARADTPSEALRAAEIRVQDANYSATEFSVDQTQGVGVCHGDSGGPAFAMLDDNLYLVGITSRGTDADCAELAVETRVSSYMKWINSVLAGE